MIPARSTDMDFTLIDLTVCNGSTSVYVPSNNEPSPGHRTISDAIPDGVFHVSLKGHGVGARALLKCIDRQNDGTVGTEG